MYLLSQKLVLVKVVTLHIPIIWKWIIEDGEGNGHNTNKMGCGEQPYIVPLKNMALSGTPFF